MYLSSLQWILWEIDDNTAAIVLSNAAAFSAQPALWGAGTEKSQLVVLEIGGLHGGIFNSRNCKAN